MSLTETFIHLFHPRRSNNHRPKFLHYKPLLFLSLIALGFYQMVFLFSTLELKSGNVLGYASNITTQQVVTQTNKIRENLGLVTLSNSDVLAQAAHDKAEDMFANQYWAHTSPTGKEPWDFMKHVGYSYKVAGENLARDFDVTPHMMTAWMESPTHKANIVNPRYREIGIAVVDGRLYGVEPTLVVQMFGAPVVGTAKPSVQVPAISTTQTSAKDTNGDVLSLTVVPQGQLNNGILFSPQLVLKAVFLSIIFLLLVVLVYDGFVARHRNTVRMVSKNLAHIILLVFIAYLVIVFRVGVVSL